MITMQKFSDTLFLRILAIISNPFPGGVAPLLLCDAALRPTSWPVPHLPAHHLLLVLAIIIIIVTIITTTTIIVIIVLTITITTTIIIIIITKKDNDMMFFSLRAFSN